MPFKTITITEDAYTAIKRLKANDESFSELFLRISPKRVTATSMLGSWNISDKEFETIKLDIRKNRESLNRDLEKRHKQVWDVC